MQIRGKILTIAGIVLLFGYFIKDSLKAPYDPTQVVMVGNDTLGRDWGAMADQAAQKLQNQNSEEKVESVSSADDGGLKTTNNGSLINPNEDPYTKQKFNQQNYSTIESPDGREIITGYNRPEAQENEENNYQTRHQKEMNEPQMIYKY